MNAIAVIAIAFAVPLVLVAGAFTCAALLDSSAYDVEGGLV